MKKIISCVLMLALTLSLFAGCAGEPAETTAPATTAPAGNENLAAAREYLYTMYKDATEATPADYVVVGKVVIGTDAFEIEWTADSETVQFIRGDDNMVTVDVDEKNPEEVSYNLTATLTDANGNTETVSFAHRVPAAIIIDAGMSYEEIVEAAYQLEADLEMPEPQRLYGVITEINDEYSEKYDNITVTIQIGELADKPIKCFRLSGEGVAELAVGDDITVEGILKNYKGQEIEFDKGCLFLGKGEHIDQSATLEAAYAVEDGLTMADPIVLQGVITEAEEYSEKYGNITVTMVVDGIEDKPVMAFRLVGEGAAELAVGDTITVAGIIKNYKGTIEFDQGCVLVPNDQMKAAKTVLAAYGLEEDLAMNTAVTLTGVITEAEEYSEKYSNITVTMVVAGLTEKPIVCFRLAGEGAADLAVGNTITVTGTLKNYKGTIEFDQGCTLDAVQ